MSLVDPAQEVADESQDTPGQTQNQPPVDDVPEKYRGKSVKEIISMHENAERELGRARNDIGTHRKLVDELIGLRRAPAATQQQEKPAPVTSTQLIENPEETITQVATRIADARVADQRQRLSQIETDLAEERLRKKHGNFEATVSAPEFQDWARKSEYRIGLITKAAQGDFAASDEILSLYAETRPAKANADGNDGKDNLAEARAAATVKSGGSGVNKVVDSSAQGKKTYSRRELAKMYMDDHATYARLHDSGELAKAYEEKRITP